mgnify:CR=1 FL=1
MSARRDPTALLWAISAADLAANLLCFFVLQFAMSELDIERFRAASEGIGRGLGVETRQAPKPRAALSVPEFTPRAALSVDYLSALLAAETAPGRPLSVATVARRGDRDEFSLPGGPLFEPGGDKLGAEAEPVLFALAGLLSGVRNGVAIAGHARADGTAAGWELALLRASSIAARLRATGYTRPLTISGQAADSAGTAPERIEILIGEGQAR